MRIYYPTLDLKTCGPILFEILSPNLCLDCRYLRYLRYIYSKVEGNYRWHFCCINCERALLISGYIFKYEEIYVVLSMKFSLHWWHLTTWDGLIQVYVWSHNKLYLVTRDNLFSSQQTHLISWVDSVLYHWLDRIWNQSSIYSSDL